MVATGDRRSAPFLAAVLVLLVAVVVLLVTACTGRPETANRAPVVPTLVPSTTSAVPSPNPDPASDPDSTFDPAGPLTGDEVAWLDGVTTLGKKMDKVLTDSPANVTPSVMRSLAQQLSGCARALNRLGPPTERLKVIQALANKGCSAYEKGSRCFATAASVGIPLSGSAAARKQDKALNCGFAAQGKGLLPFTEAAAEGLNLKMVPS